MTESDHDWAYDVERREEAGQVPRRLLQASSLDRFSDAIMGLIDEE